MYVGFFPRETERCCFVNVNYLGSALGTMSGRMDEPVLLNWTHARPLPQVETRLDMREWANGVIFVFQKWDVAVLTDTVCVLW